MWMRIWMINMRETTKTKTNMRCLFLLTIMGIFFYNKKSDDFQYKRNMIFHICMYYKYI